MIWPDVDMLHVALQLELKRLKLIGSRKLLWVSEFYADEHSSIGQVDPMVDARRWNSGPFDHLPHFVHQAQANLAVSLVLDNAPDAVQVESNWFINNLDFHLDALCLLEVRDFFFRFAAAFAKSCFTRKRPVGISTRMTSGNAVISCSGR